MNPNSSRIDTQIHRHYGYLPLDCSAVKPQSSRPPQPARKHLKRRIFRQDSCHLSSFHDNTSFHYQNFSPREQLRAKTHCLLAQRMPLATPWPIEKLIGTPALEVTNRKMNRHLDKKALPTRSVCRTRTMRERSHIGLRELQQASHAGDVIVARAD